MKKYFLTGLALILPITITLIILFYLIGIFTHPFIGFAKVVIAHMGIDTIKHDSISLLLAHILTLVVLTVFTTVLGFVAQKIFFHGLIKLMQKIFSRIPIVKPIYLTLKELTKIMFNKDVKAFGKTVLISFPSSSTKAIGFEVLRTPSEITKKIPHLDSTVFVPTAPHPISGFLLFMGKKDIQPVDLSFEDALKYIISCGVIVPEEKNDPSLKN